MSVYKSKRGESSVQFIETARQLEAHTFACCMKAPKRYERFLTGRIMELSSEVHDRVRAANNIWPTNRHDGPGNTPSLAAQGRADASEQRAAEPQPEAAAAV